MVSTDLQAIFVFAAVIHLAAFVGFLLAFLSAIRTDAPNKQSVLLSACIVLLVTQSAYWAQVGGVGETERADGQVVYIVEWLGYALSLRLIGASLALFVGLKLNEIASLGNALFLVGIGGVLGLFISSEFRGLQWAVALGVTGVYILFFIYLIGRGSRWSNVEWLTVLYFAFSTITFYVLPYFAGPPIYGIITPEFEHVLYLIGNVLTKIILPGWEAAIIMK